MQILHFLQNFSLQLILLLIFFKVITLSGEDTQHFSVGRNRLSSVNFFYVF
jgi:hypothetical protein